MDGGDLVRLAVDLALTEHQSLITGPGTDQMQRAVIVAAAAGAPNGLAINRHHLALNLASQGLCPSHEAALERVRIDQHEAPPKRVVRRDAVRQSQEGLQPSLLAAPVKFDVLPTFRAGNHRDRGDHENVGQLMIASACRPWVDKPVKARRQIFNHGARLPSPQTGNGRNHHQSAAGPTFMREPCFRVYGVRKVWRQLLREGTAVARCTVARLMRTMGLQGVVRGKRVRTTISNAAAPCPLDRVNRQFNAPRPNALWVSDFTYVATWAGFVYVAFVIDVFARRIVGWRVSRTAHAGFVLDALEQALYQRRPVRGGGLVHHSDRGQYVSIKYTERLAQAGVEPSVGSVGDSGACPRAGKAGPGGQCPRRNHQRPLLLLRHRIGVVWVVL